MGEAWVVAAIALAAAAFMLRFLIALLREGEPSVCYWVAPVRREIEREAKTGEERNLGFPIRIYADEDSRSIESDYGGYRLELEYENSAKEYASGLFALDAPTVSAILGRRSIRKGIDVLRERRI
jgi:hypothetical protein